MLERWPSAAPAPRSLTPVVAYISHHRDRYCDPGDDQAETISRYAASDGLEVVRLFVDLDVGGANTRLEGLQEALKCLKAGHARGLVIEDAGRLGRGSAATVLRLFDELESAGLALWECRHGRIDSSIKAGLLSSTIEDDDEFPDRAQYGGVRAISD